MDSNEFIKCSACGELKPVEDFSPNHRSKTGHLSICKTCQGARVKAGRGRANLLPPRFLPLATPNLKALHPGN